MLSFDNTLLLEAGLAPRWLAKIGDVSYSLYLVHWPVLALTLNAWTGRGDGLPLSLRLTVLALSVALTIALLRLVEEPVRRANWLPSRGLVAMTIVTSLGVVLIVPTANLIPGSSADYQYARRGNWGLGQACDYSDTFSYKAHCAVGSKKELLVWGDSFAMHLVPGLLIADQTGLVQATRSGCGPLLGLAGRRIVTPNLAGR